MEFIEERCTHDQLYEIIVNVTHENRKAFVCKNCVGDYVFRLSARGPLIINRR